MCFPQSDQSLSINLLFNPYLIETPFDAFANTADPDQAALIRAESLYNELFIVGGA